MLLAKSGIEGTEETLAEHTSAVERATEEILRLFPGLPTELRLAARFHDMGKAATGFQDVLRGGPAWMFRHEILSAAIFRRCFDLEQGNMYRAYLALLTHHKNFGSEQEIGRAFLHAQTGTRRDLRKAWTVKWRELLHRELLDLFPEDLRGWVYDPDEDSPANDVETYFDELKTVWADPLTARARGALVAADHLASAHLGRPLTGHGLTRDQLAMGVRQQLGRRGHEWTSWSPLQQRCAETEGNALLVAPTGSGKTEAALLWALKNRTRGQRIFYVLPYQVSINAMATRLAQLFPDAQGRTSSAENDNISALHSNVDLATFASATKEGDESDIAIQKALRNRDAARKIYAPVKVTTAYQLLRVFFGEKFFEVGLLELTDALVVFDEIHAYDGHTLGLILAMLEYLQKLGARVLIMTATLPEPLKEALTSAAGIAQELALAPSDPILREARREFRILHEPLESPEVIARIREAVHQGLSVAVVCNTVRKAMKLSTFLDDCKPYLIHSRFTLGDRASREDKDELQKVMNSGRVVIATQVLEVSLDVSFEVMFTELAPADALLQRAGRVNRHGAPMPAAPVWVCASPDRGSKKIYGEELLEPTKVWLVKQIDSERPLDFAASLEWLNAVYPQGLRPTEATKMQSMRTEFRKMVSGLKPMTDPPVSADLEANLFQSITVVPAQFETDYVAFRGAGRHLEAKRLTVNVDLRAWQGAIHGALTEGTAISRQLKIVGEKKEVTFALCAYTPESGLDISTASDQGIGNFL